MAKFYLTAAEAKAKGLPSVQKQIDSYNRAIEALKKAAQGKATKKNPQLRRVPQKGTGWLKASRVKFVRHGGSTNVLIERSRRKR